MITLCEFGMAEVLEINTTIWLSSGLMNDIQGWASGAPSPPSFVPNLLSPYTDRMTFYERLSNFWKFTFSYFIYHFRHNRPQNEIFRLVSKNPNFPDLWTKLAPKASILLNNDLFLDNARPWSHNVKYIGGDGLEKFSKLDDYWSKIIADDHRDLVIISFGSIANTSGLACSLCTMHEPPKNVLLMEWLPQKELLDTNLKPNKFRN
uniref:glucuronosyltransferase n=1 Tax=Romanomermis culicivorax TaxID=13658 RepID=A0A915JD65_ROMCU